MAKSKKKENFSDSYDKFLRELESIFDTKTIEENYHNLFYLYRKHYNKSKGKAKK